MADTAEIEALLARVTAATGPDRKIDMILWGVATNSRQDDPYCPKLTGSLDAIVGLIERELPGWDYILEHVNAGLTIRAQLGPEKEGASAFGETDALALCAAFLRARLALIAGREK